MTWKVESDDRARRELRALDENVQARILRYLRERIATGEDPRRFDRSLRSDKAGLWRYRVGDYRLICDINDGDEVILVLRGAHPSGVYR